MDRLDADTLGVVCSFCDAQTLVATLIHASKTTASAVDAHAAARAKRLWSTSAELERRGVRLGAAFLARRSRPPRKAADGSCIPLASRTLTDAERGEADWDVWTQSELPLPGRVLIVDVIVRTAPAKYAGPSQYDIPVIEDYADLVADGTVIGRRSVILDAMPSDDAVHFAPLRIAEGLEPSSFWNDSDISASGQDRPDHYWLAEVANVVGGHQFVCRPPAFSGDPSVGSCTSVNHRFVADCLKHGIIDAYRPSQLPESHRYVSVRVDLMRLSDGKSMCLGEHDVGVKSHGYWPGQEPPDFSDEEEVEEEHILLTPGEVVCTRRASFRNRDHRAKTTSWPFDPPSSPIILRKLRGRSTSSPSASVLVAQSPSQSSTGMKPISMAPGAPTTWSSSRSSRSTRGPKYLACTSLHD